jgi:hypothetical protein
LSTSARSIRETISKLGTAASSTYVNLHPI